MKYYKHFVFIVILSIIINLLSCNIEEQNNSKITEGKYLLDMDSNVYIEILNQEELYFHNIDFSLLQAELDGFGIAFDAQTQLDMKKHNFDITAYALYVFLINDENYGDICLKIVYLNKLKTLNMYNTTYLLKR